LQLRWGANGVDMERQSIRFYHSKNAMTQSVPMHRRVREALLPIWEKKGKPVTGHVFLNRLGEPYKDTRLGPIPGGNRTPRKTSGG